MATMKGLRQGRARNCRTRDACALPCDATQVPPQTNDNTLMVRIVPLCAQRRFFATVWVSASNIRVCEVDFIVPSPVFIHHRLTSNLSDVESDSELHTLALCYAAAYWLHRAARTLAGHDQVRVFRKFSGVDVPGVIVICQ